MQDRHPYNRARRGRATALPVEWAWAALLVFAVFATLMATWPAAAGPAPELARATAAGDDIGDVVRARGRLSARQASALRALSSGDDVLFGDVLKTGAATRAEVAFVDGGRLSLGDNSELAVDEMVYDPNGTSLGVLTLTRGVFRMVSGRINKDGGTFTVKTPVAVIGVRGTDFWGAQEADKLTMALLDDGELTITAGGATAVLTDPLQAVVVERGQAPGPVFTLTPEQVRAAASTVAW